jgi:hypothetical protein
MPLEQSDLDGLRHVGTLTDARDRWLEQAEGHRRGLQHYSRKVTGKPEEWIAARTSGSYPNAQRHAYLTSGLEMDSTRTETVKPSFGREYVVEVRMFRIPRGFEAVTGYDFKIPSYEALRAAHEHEAREQAKALDEARLALQAAIAYHAVHEPERKVEAKADTLHLAARRFHSMGNPARAACGSSSIYAKTTEDRSLVTCSRCLRSMEADQKAADEQAAVVALAARVEAYLREHGPSKVSTLRAALGVADAKTMNRALEKSAARSDFDSPAKWHIAYPHS